MVRSCVLVLAVLTLQAGSEPVPQALDSANTNDSATLYPEAVILVPSNETAGQKPVVLMVPELRGLLPDLNSTDPAYNEVQDVASNGRTGAVILVASLDPARATNLTDKVPSANNSSELQLMKEKSAVEEEFIRRRRSPGELDPLVRKKRTNYGYGQPCMICGMMPQTKQIIINIPILKKPKKKKQPSYYPSPCGQPQCGQPQYHPPPPPPPPPCGYPQCGQPQYHPPPPPPPPPPQHYPQTCNVCQGGGGYPPSSGSYSHSSSQSSSSSYSGGWGKK